MIGLRIFSRNPQAKREAKARRESHRQRREARREAKARRELEISEIVAFGELIPEMEALARTLDPSTYSLMWVFPHTHTRWVDLRVELRVLDVALPHNPKYLDVAQLIALAKARRLDKAQQMYPVDTDGRGRI